MFCKRGKAAILTLLLVLASCGEPPQQLAEEYAKAKLLYSQGKMDEAVRSLEVLVHRNGGFAPGRLLWGRALYFHRDYEKAREVLASLQSDHPESLEASLWLARTLNQLNRPAEAEALLTRLMAVNSDDPRLAYQMALIRENRNDLEGAQAFLAMAAAADEDQGLVHYEAARIWHQLNNSVRTQAELSQALGFLPASSLLRRPMEKLQQDLASRAAGKGGRP